MKCSFTAVLRHEFTTPLGHERRADAIVQARLVLAIRNTGPDGAHVFVVVAGRSYPRGGGESGTEDDSSGAGLNEVAKTKASVGAISEAERTRTAAGPISDSAIVARGSAALLHEQA
jgi:hypothetical protein